jgi:hypothetical protein
MGCLLKARNWIPLVLPWMIPALQILHAPRPSTRAMALEAMRMVMSCQLRRMCWRLKITSAMRMAVLMEGTPMENWKSLLP